MSQEVLGYKFGIDAEEAKASVGSFRKQLKDAQKDLIEMADKFGESSDQAVKAAKRVAELKDRIGDAKSMAEAFNPDARFKAVSQSVQGIAGAFAAVQGAMALFGVESEDLQKQLLKVQGALALSEGLNTFLDTGIQGLKNLKSVAIDTFKGIKTAIGSTGIGLFVVALGAIVAYWDDIKRAVSGVSEEQEKSLNNTKTAANLEKEKVDNLNKQDNILKLQGKSEKDILNIKIAQTDQAITAYEAQLKGQKAMQDAQYKTALRNREILEGVLRWLQMPLSAILGSIDLIGKAFGKDFGLEKAFIGWEASFLIDPKEIKENGEKANKELEKTLLDLRNTQAGYKLQLKEIDKKASDEKTKKDDEKAKEEADKLKQQEEKKAEILSKAKLVIAEKDKTDREKDLYELDLKYKEELKLFKDGTEEKKKVQEAYEIERQAINSKYDKIELEEKKKKDKELFDLDKSKLDQIINDNNTKYDLLLASVDKEKELLKKALDEKLISEQEYFEAVNDLNNKLSKKKEDDIKNEKKLQIDQIKESLSFASSYAESAAAISDALYATKLDQVVKGSKEEEKIMRQQFETNKKIQIAQTIISGLNGIVNALSADSLIPDPVGSVLKGINAAMIGATTAMTVRKIASQQFGSVNMNIGSGGSSGGGSAPMSPGSPVQQTVTSLNQSSINAIGNQAIKAYVVETDIRNSQTRVNRILTNSRFK
jgi:hypothetical protein